MKTYYINRNGKQYGPLTLDKIQTSTLYPTDMVWCQGMPQWEMAKDVEDFKDRFSINTSQLSTPPPLPIQHYNQNQQNSEKNSSVAGSIVGLLIIIVIAITVIVIIREMNDRELKEQNPFYRMR